MWAVSRGCNEATEVLLRNGADLSLLDQRDRTVIHLAIGNHSTLKLLLKVGSLLIDIYDGCEST